MPLITTISEVKDYVKVNFTNERSSLPNMTRAEERFLLPILGQTLYNAVIAVPTASPVTDELITYCKYAVAPLAYLLELPFIQTQLTDTGLRTAENENYTAAHKWEFEKIAAALEEDGCWALERLIKYLYANASTYSWTPTDEYKIIFKHAEEFKKYFPLHQPFRTFENLRPLITQIQDQYIITSIGETFFEELRTYAAADANTLKAILLLKKAVANLTIMRAVEVMSVRVTREGFTVQLSDSETASTAQANAPENQLSMTRNQCQLNGESYLNELKEFLNDTATASVFATYFDSDYYTDPTATVTDQNTNRKGVYGF
jgi:hypothetical protein